MFTSTNNVYMSVFLSQETKLLSISPIILQAGRYESTILSHEIRPKGK